MRERNWGQIGERGAVVVLAVSLTMDGHRTRLCRACQSRYVPTPRVQMTLLPFPLMAFPLFCESVCQAEERDPMLPHPWSADSLLKECFCHVAEIVLVPRCTHTVAASLLKCWRCWKSIPATLYKYCLCLVAKMLMLLKDYCCHVVRISSMPRCLNADVAESIPARLYKYCWCIGA